MSSFRSLSETDGDFQSIDGDFENQTGSPNDSQPVPRTVDDLYNPQPLERSSHVDELSEHVSEKM